jgi:hypothetical protein
MPRRSGAAPGSASGSLYSWWPLLRGDDDGRGGDVRRGGDSPTGNETIGGPQPEADHEQHPDERPLTGGKGRQGRVSRHLTPGRVRLTPAPGAEVAARSPHPASLAERGSRALEAVRRNPGIGRAEAPGKV